MVKPLPIDLYWSFISSAAHNLPTMFKIQAECGSHMTKAKIHFSSTLCTSYSSIKFVIFSIAASEFGLLSSASLKIIIKKKNTFVNY